VIHNLSVRTLDTFSKLTTARLQLSHQSINQHGFI